ncbi:MAG TPA: hypothetical protein VEC16_06930 [Alphaproteobacteria bacterium]|nr:hypothetical protein [Alphaproteobacteria bacterium]
MNDTIYEKITQETPIRNMKIHPLLAERWNSPDSIPIEEFTVRIKDSISKRSEYIASVNDLISNRKVFIEKLKQYDK